MRFFCLRRVKYAAICDHRSPRHTAHFFDFFAGRKIRKFSTFLRFCEIVIFAVRTQNFRNLHFCEKSRFCDFCCPNSDSDRSRMVAFRQQKIVLFRDFADFADFCDFCDFCRFCKFCRFLDFPEKSEKYDFGRHKTRLFGVQNFVLSATFWKSFRVVSYGDRPLLLL